MDGRKLDMVVLGSQRNILYFLGYITGRLYLPSYLLVPRDGDPILVTGRDDREEAERSFGGEIVEYVNYSLGERMRPYPSTAVDALMKTMPVASKNSVKSEWRIGGLTYPYTERLPKSLLEQNFMTYQMKVC
jgi:Xaa-Pro aminopeptidase